MKDKKGNEIIKKLDLNDAGAITMVVMGEITKKKGKIKCSKSGGVVILTLEEDKAP